MKTYYLKTFGCQMNYADSEKINMILMSAGLRKVIDPTKADIVIMNTCSVRQKGEDKVFGFMNEVSRFHRDKKIDTQTQRNILFGITGCMVRKTGLARRYLFKNPPVSAIGTEGSSARLEDSPVSVANQGGLVSDNGAVSPPTPPHRGVQKLQKRHQVERITLLESSESLLNYDDELFLRSPLIDFVFRIEEVSFLTKVLSLISGEDVGNDAKFNEYLQVKQLSENPASANVIIQTGCDNYCTYCIVPYTRGREMSRPQDEIVTEICTVVATGAKEVTLLGQNVNSYGKETKKKLWNAEEMRWLTPLSRGEERSEGGFYNPPVKGGRAKRREVSLPELTTKYHIPYRLDLEEKAKELRRNQTPFEKIFWYEILKQETLKQYKFTRQKPIGDYIADFYCSELQLIIELDGDQHTENLEYDKKRTEELGEFGLRVVRYANQEVLRNKPGVYENLMEVIREQEQNPPFSPLDRAVVEEQNPPLSPLDRGVITPFRELLESINEIEGLDRIRFTSSNPHDMTRDILDAHFDLPRMCNYLHLALQSGSDSMLRRMNRKHTYADFKAQLDYLRLRDPLFSISTDIIVGFPGETEEEFQATAHAMQECQFDFVYIARYSPRSGTLATDRYEDDISPEEKARRWTILNDILRETVHARNLLMVGREEEILISGSGKDDVLVGRTRNWKEVHIPVASGVQIGDIIKVKIMRIDGWVLRGEM